MPKPLVERIDGHLVAFVLFVLILVAIIATVGVVAWEGAHAC